MRVQEKKSFATSAVISMVVAITVAMMVSVFTYMNKESKSQEELRYYAEEIEKNSYELRSEIRRLQAQLAGLEKEVSQNRNLINTFDTNLKFQAEVVKSLLSEEKQGAK